MYDIAEQYYRYVLDLKNLKLPNVDYIQCLNGISGLFRIKGELDSAKLYISRSLHYTDQINDPLIFSNSMQFYFNIFFTAYQLDSIKSNLPKMKKDKFLNNEYYASTYYTVISYYYFLKRQLDSALFYSKKVVTERSKSNNRMYYFSGVNNMGQMFMESGQYDSAAYYLELTKDSVIIFKNSHLVNLNIEHLEKLYKITNDTTKLNDLLAYKAVSDSINKVQIDKINLISKLYITSEQLDESVQKNKDYQFFITILIVLTVLISAFIIFFIYYNIRLKESLKNQKILVNDKISTLKKLEIEINNKNRLISILSHDLINPINSTSQLLEILKNDYYTMGDKDKYEIILELSRASVNTYDLLKDILNWMRVSEDNLYNFNPTNVKIFSLVQNVYEHLHLQLENKKQKFINNINRDHILNIDANLMSTIIRNLLTNASKYSELDRKITIYSKVTDNNYIICIEDEGIGMKKELIDLLKDNSYSSILQLDVKENSFGYGVVICKDFMKVHNGWLEYESDGKTGTIAKLIFERSTFVKGA